MLAPPDILIILADGRFHSGESIGRRLGLTRAAVWKKIKSLREIGISIQSVQGRGYRIERGYGLFNASDLEQCLLQSGVKLAGIKHFWELESTNSFLRDFRGDQPGLLLVVADRQTAGRGRRGKTWFSSVPGNIALSIGQQLDCAPAALSGLSLVAGLAVTESIKPYIDDVRLKWPNDIYLDERKLGGILLEISAEAGGPTRVVTGLGLNLLSAAVASGGVDQPWCSLDQYLTDAMPSRNDLICRLVAQIDSDYQVFLERGLSAFQQRWLRADYLAGEIVEVNSGTTLIAGVAEGISESGDLLVRIDGDLRAVNAGEVSIRRQV